MAQINPLTGTSAKDNFVVSGAPFNGVDVSADGRQVVNQPSELNEFVIADDRFVLNAKDLGITGASVFVNGTVGDLTTSTPAAKANIVVVQGTFANAGTAATALAGTGVASGAGVFLYFNQTLGINRLVYSANLGSATADISILGNIRTLTGDPAKNALPTFTATNFLLADNTVVGDKDNNMLLGTAAKDFIDGRGGNDLINGGGASDTLTGGAGADTFAFAGDRFDGGDVSAPGRQVIANEDFITDFDFTQDKYQLNAADFRVSGDVKFVALDANAPGASIPTGANVIVLRNADNDNNPATAFNAGTSANQIANLVQADGAGFFVYFNSVLQLNRLVYSTNLNDPTADLKIISRQTDLTGQAAIDALAKFSAANFNFTNPTPITSNPTTTNPFPTTAAGSIGTKSQGLAEGRIIDLTDYAGQALKVDVTTKGDAAFTNNIGFYAVTDAVTGAIQIANGTILKPGDANYAIEAIKSAVLQAGKIDSKVGLDVPGGGIYAPVVVAQGSFTDFVNKNPTNGGDGSAIHAYFNYLGANPDKFNHFRLESPNTFAVEDQFGGGDRDFNDLTINLNFRTV